MANVKEYNEIMKSMQAGNFKPVYLLHGEEPFYIDKISHYIEHRAIEEHERDFNLTVFYGRDAKEADLLETLKRFPMMAQRQVVIMREAQDYQGDWSNLEPYFENPIPSTVFVIDYKYKKVDSRKRWPKLITKHGEAFHSSRHYDNELPGVIEQFVKSLKYRISPSASVLMAEYLGNDLEKIEGEIKKLTISIPLSQEIEQNDVRKHIGISREYSSFDYVDALAERNVERSFRIAQFLGKNEKNTPLVLTLASLFSHFSKVMMYHSSPDKSVNGLIKYIPGLGSPWFAGKIKSTAPLYSPRKTALIIEKLREVDARLKGVDSAPIEEKELLKELTYFILN